MALEFPDPELAADGVVLRRFDDGDVPWITATCSDPETTRWLSRLPSPYTEGAARAYVEYARLSWSSATAAPFAISDESRTGLGAIELHLGAQPSVGYWLNPSARGRGVATIAVRLLAGWAFGELSLDRLLLTTHPDNVASQRVAERSGFTHEGIAPALLAYADGSGESQVFSLSRS